MRDGLRRWVCCKINDRFKKECKKKPFGRVKLVDLMICTLDFKWHWALARPLCFVLGQDTPDHSHSLSLHRSMGGGKLSGKSKKINILFGGGGRTHNRLPSHPRQVLSNSPGCIILQCYDQFHRIGSWAVTITIDTWNFNCCNLLNLSPSETTVW